MERIGLEGFRASTGLGTKLNVSFLMVPSREQVQKKSIQVRNSRIRYTAFGMIQKAKLGWVVQGLGFGSVGWLGASNFLGLSFTG